MRTAITIVFTIGAIALVVLAFKFRNDLKAAQQ